MGVVGVWRTRVGEESERFPPVGEGCLRSLRGAERVADEKVSVGLVAAVAGVAGEREGRIGETEDLGLVPSVGVDPGQQAQRLPLHAPVSGRTEHAQRVGKKAESVIETPLSVADLAEVARRQGLANPETDLAGQGQRSRRTFGRAVKLARLVVYTAEVDEADRLSGERPGLVADRQHACVAGFGLTLPPGKIVQVAEGG